jgi:uncharacterized membrane protein
VRLVTAALTCVPATVQAQATDGSGWKAAVGFVHPFLVHFPVALIVVGLVAEILCIARREGRYADAARFMIVAAAWISIPAALTGFARADTITLDASEQSLFAVHRVAGIATPVLAFLCAGLAEGVRRSGQIWELMLYRIFLVLAAVSAIVAGFYGGEIVHGVFPFW